MKEQKIAGSILIFCAALTFLLVFCTGCGNTRDVASEQSTAIYESQSDVVPAIEPVVETTEEETEELTEEEKEFEIAEYGIPESYPMYSLNEETVKVVGRSYNYKNNLWCSLSGSGVEFVYYGEKLEMTFRTDAARSSDTNRARVAVYVNDERVLDLMLKDVAETVTVYEGKRHLVHIKVVKLSEATSSAFGIEPVLVKQGEYIVPEKEKSHKIEFIGDSITCGYGVDDENQDHHFSTATEDVTRAWAYKTARLLDADYSIVSYSGWGIISGYTADSSKKSASQCVPDVYEKTAYSYIRYDGDVFPQDIDWSFEEFIPDAVVINLGTNDASYCDTPEKKQEFTEGYKAFLTMIRKNNPDAYIFCALGTMGNTMLGSIKTAVQEYTEEAGDTKVEVISLLQQSSADGLAADWHPTEKTHEKAANLISLKIKNTLGW